MIRVEHASVSFGGLQAVRDVSFDIPAGRITGLIGPNGAGKSTLIKTIFALTQCLSGTIRFRGRDIAGRRVTILMVEQNARQALRIADRGHVLVAGRNYVSDTGAALLSNDHVRRSFLGGAPA